MLKSNSVLSSLRPVLPRDVDEAHRAATPLELFFDLVFVIAIAAAAAGLHHSVVEAHFVDGIIKYTAIFFAIWWAWMNYTWFSSAYDNDDSLFRILTLVIIAGALTLAAGVGHFFKSADLALVVTGFVIMRIAMVGLWLRAYKDDVARKQTALWYAVGISLVQIFWVALLLSQPLAPVLLYTGFALGAFLELLVPFFAEKKTQTPWHRHHIIERYGLLNIIVLGETLLAGSIALNSAAEHFDVALIHIAVSALVIVFAMWWLYFSREEHLNANDLTMALTWGYGHLLIYIAGAAVGAGFAVLVDIVSGHATVSLLVGDYAVAVPIALYFMGLWFVRDRFVLAGLGKLVLPVFSVVVLLVPLFLGLEGIALTMVLCVFTRSSIACRDKFV
jgi:low temperature requirement protein LtrA